ncbi:MFS transporter [Ornithinimicrobium sp. F0845]|uniref:MFS transporter n=1 Tax=Ornithinimicrobium sp. F0845 TaxID=2926412 RepID=UPI001FF474E5|nr:MFS transporter [Ornithinimicrobium sp. F0845]MCK0111602.1 MFS transporter [Ornithinimicrobium sp. F0845]
MSAPDTAPAARRGSAVRRGPAALQDPGFRRLTTAWVFTNIADSALYLMLAVWIKDLTGSDSAAALTFAMLGLPALLAPFLGQIADRYSRKRLLVIANLLVAGVVTTLLVVDSADQIAWIYAVVLVYAAVAYLTASAQTGLVRDLLPDEQLASGNGLLSSIDQALRLISPLVGTALYAVWGPHAVVILTTVAFLIAAGLLATMKVTESEPETSEQRGTYWTELTAGFRHLAAIPVLGRLTIVVAIAFGATGLVNVAVFPAIEQGLGLPAEALGPLISVQGVGAVLGGLTAAALIGRWGEVRVFGIGVLLLALALLPLATSSLVLVVAGLAVGGFGVTWSVVSFITLRQRLTPPRLQGRTGSATAIAINLPQTLVTLAGAAVLGIIDYRLLVVATGVVVILSLVLLPRQAAAQASAAPEPAPPHTVDG